MLYTLIFLGLLVAGWLVCAFLPWLVLSVATRGRAGLVNLPVCLFTGLVAALAMPAFGLTGSTGLRLSFILALAAPCAMLAVRRFSVGALPAHRTHPRSPEEARPK